MELASKARTVGSVAEFKLWVQLVCGLEVRRAERSTVALESVSQRGAPAVDVHPRAQIAEHVLTGLVAVQRFEPGPVLRLGLADEGEDRFGKDRTLAVEAFPGNGNVSVLEKMRFDDGLERGVGRALHQAGPEMAPVTHSDFGSRRT